MYKNNIKFFTLIIVIFLLTSCDDYKCIEANDTGDYNNEAITVYSEANGCKWSFDDDVYGSGSEAVNSCIQSKKQTILLEDNTICSISNVTCNDLKSCLLTGSSNVNGCLSDKGASFSNCYNLSFAELQAAYKTCTQQCITDCESKLENLSETIWVNNGVTVDSNSGILSPNGEFIVQVSNSIKLKNSLEKSVVFTSKSNTLQFDEDKPFILSYPERFQLSGYWCMNGNKNNCVNIEQQMGTNGLVPNSQKNTVLHNFLRRGVIVLKDIPESGNVDSYGNYTGPILKPDFSTWYCEKPSIFDNNENNNTYTCSTGYEINHDGNYNNKNNELYPIENTFQKNHGGFVIPNNVIEYITREVPYPDAICTTVSSGIERTCVTQASNGAPIYEWFEENQNNNNNVTNDANIVNENVMNNVALLDNKRVFEREFLYPNKLALRIITEPGASGSCNAIIRVKDDNTQDRMLTVNADNNWYFLTDNNNNFITLNKNINNTLVSTSMKNQNFNSANFYNVEISFPGSQTWTDKDGKQVACGEGMLAFFIPQNEILINKSGFVSFKNLFAPVSSCSEVSSSTSNYNCISSSSNIKFTIINPMYNLRNSNDSLVDYNFYEYIQDNNIDKPEMFNSLINVSDASANSWSDKIFVRKGQILRFDESSWYDIIPQINGGYNIKNKIISLGGGKYENIAYGLALKIDERPAFVCDGMEQEDISYYNSDGEYITSKNNVIQCYDLEEYKGAYRRLRVSGVPLKGSIEEYGKLNTDDFNLGARKLISISSSNTNYGNFSSMYYLIDDNSNTYESTFTLPVSSKSYIAFVSIDNDNFRFTNNSNNNNGDYTITFSPTLYFTNGKQLSVALADTDFDMSNPDAQPIAWVVKYNTDKTSEDYGSLDPSSNFEFDDNGRLVKKGTTNYQIKLDTINFPTLSSLSDDDYKKLRLFFRIIDVYETCDGEKGVGMDEILCKCTTESESAYRNCNAVSCGDNVSVQQKKFSTCSSNLYANNSGSYRVNISTSKGDNDWMNSVEGAFSSILMAPVLEIFDGKSLQLEVGIDNKLKTCDSTVEDSGDCYIYYAYNTDGNHAKDVGESCIRGEYDCYKSCNDLSLEEYRTFCRTFNSGTGFVERFYKNIIQDKVYNNLITTCFALMFSFYGLYFLLGLADFNQEELIKKLIKITFIYAMISNIGWSIYRNTFVAFFKDGMDYISFSIVNSFSDNANIDNAIAKNFYGDKSLIFSNINSTIHFVFSDNTASRIGSVFFSSWVGPCLWILIWIAIFIFFLSVITAMVLYTVSQIFISFFLGFGPIFFVFLIFDRTKGMFDKWISNLIGFSFEQIFILTCASLFNAIIFNIIKGIFSYKVCYEPIWYVNVFGKRLTFLVYWKATNSDDIPGLSQIILIFLLAYLSKNFIKFMAGLGSRIGGADMSSGSVGSALADSTSAMFKPVTDGIKKLGGKLAKSAGDTFGYHSREDVAKYNKTADQLVEGNERATALAFQRASDRMDELNEGDDGAWRNDPEKQEQFNKFFKEEYDNAIAEDPATLRALKERKMTTDDLFNSKSSDLYRSSSVLGYLWYKMVKSTPTKNVLMGKKNSGSYDTSSSNSDMDDEFMKMMQGMSKKNDTPSNTNNASNISTNEEKPKDSDEKNNEEPNVSTPTSDKKNVSGDDNN